MNAHIQNRQVAATPRLPRRIRRGEGRGEVLIILLMLLISWSSSAAAVFTNNLTISETNTAFEGQEIVIGGATVTIDGLHSFNSLLLTNGAVLTHSLGSTGGVRLNISRDLFVDSTCRWRFRGADRLTP